MEDYIEKEGRRVATDELKMRRFRAKYPFLFPIPSPPEEERQKIKRLITDEVTGSNIFVSGTDDYLKYCVAQLIIQHGEYIDVTMMNAYRLIYILVGEDEDYPNLNEVKTPNLVIYLGYAELQNKRQGDVIEQIFEIQRVRGHRLWLYYKGSYTVFQNKYPILVDMIDKYNFTHIDLDSVSSEDYYSDEI